MPVRAVETITASRAGIPASLNEHQSEPLRGKSGLALALDLDRHDMAKQPLPGRFLVERVKRETAAHALARFDRGEEAHAIEAVIDRHLHAFGDEHRLG